MAKNKKRKLNASSSASSLSRRLHKAPKSSHASPAMKAKKKPEPTIPFDAEERILLVGEGDFSFAKSIVEHRGCCDVTATCYDSQLDLFEKYQPQAEQHIHYLEEEGQTVLFGVDATKLEAHKELKKRLRSFDRILFNFPHVGGKSTDVNRQVRFNQELLVKFFASARALVAADGTIIVTLFEGEPYTLWNIRDLARHSGLEVVRSFAFVADAYSGYSHSRTLGNLEGGGGWKGEDRDARSYVFRTKREDLPLQSQSGGKKRRRAGSSDEED